MQGLFIPFARIGSGDPVRVLRLFHNKYSGYCCIHLLCKAMYNLSLPRLSANYYGLPMTVQLRAAHESRCSLFGVSWSTAQVLYCTCLERYIYGTVQACAFRLHSFNNLLRQPSNSCIAAEALNLNAFQFERSLWLKWLAVSIAS